MIEADTKQTTSDYILYLRVLFVNVPDMTLQTNRL